MSFGDLDEDHTLGGLHSRMGRTSFWYFGRATLRGERLVRAGGNAGNVERVPGAKALEGSFRNVDDRKCGDCDMRMPRSQQQTTAGQDGIRE